MKSHTTIGIGGRALYYVCVNSVQELKKSIEWARRDELEVFILGGGSNILVSDYGVDGVVIALEGDAFNLVTPTEKGKCIKAGACCNLQRAVKLAVNRGIGGPEALAGIPGSVGGAVWMNAGGRYGEMSSFIKNVTLLAKGGHVKTLNREEIGFSYRDSGLRSGDIILDATLTGVPADPDELEDRYSEIIHEKSGEQPLDKKSCGCVFKNPSGDSAGRLIDSLGFKGQSAGGIEVSEEHANFLVNRNNGSSRDMITLMSQIYRAVLSKTGITLEPEIVMWGECGWEQAL